MNFTIFAASTVKPPHARVLTVRGSSYLSPRIDHPLCLRFAYLKSLISFIMMSSRAASSSGVRRVGGGFVAATNISYLSPNSNKVLKPGLSNTKRRSLDMAEHSSVSEGE